MTPLLDTSIVIDLLRGEPAAVDYASRLTEVPFCSEITAMEVLSAVRPGQLPVAEQILDALHRVPVDRSIARRAGEIGRRWARRRPPLAAADLIVLATADELDAELVTTSQRRYPSVIRTVNPY
jgi:predicted nucleic acid-binding protein